MEAITFTQADHTNKNAAGIEIPCVIHNDEIITLWRDANGNDYWLRIKATDVESIQVQTENPFI